MLNRAIFFIGFFLILWLKDISYLLVALAIVSLVSWRDFWKLSKKAFKSVAFFNVGITLGYLILAFYEGISPWYYIVYINLKVFTITLFMFWFFKRVSIIEFFSFSKEMSYILSITLSQIYSYKKSFEDFRLAYRARFVKSFRQREKDFIAVVFSYFLKKSMSDSHQRVLAMRARGFFD